MKKFVFQLFVFFVILGISFTWIFSNVDGFSDSYYLRFTTPKQKSMIIGVSKAAQGLQPKIFNEVLGRDDMFNYSFNAFISPFGRTYLESIKKKLNPNTKDGIFILTFDAWSLGSNTQNPNDSTNFRENDLCLSSGFVTMDPNIPYMINYYEHKYIDIFRRKQKYVELHIDGWLEVTVDMDSTSIHERLDNSVKHYNKLYTPNWKYSSLRLKYLEKTIEYLKNYGEVYLVRLPVHERMLELENSVTPDLDEKVNLLAEKHEVPYWNFSDRWSDFIYTDGVHLWKESGKTISEFISIRIKEEQYKKFSARL